MLINGTELPETLTGTDDDDIINGLGGNDTLEGRGGDDTLDGGEGNDVLRGDGGVGYTGPSGDDILNGGNGNDVLYGGLGVDTFNGGAGTDRVSFYSLTATQGVVVNLYTQTIGNDGYGNAETMTSIENLGGGTQFADTFIGNDGNNFIYASLNDTVIAGDGSDIIYIDGATFYIDGGLGDDYLGFVGDWYGTLVADGDGDGLADIVYATNGVYVELFSNMIWDDGYGNSGEILNIENIEGSELDDTILGDANTNVLSGWGGDDVVWGWSGDDLLFGGEGADQLRGDGSASYIGPSGADQIFGEGGDDIMWGGAGADYFDGGEGQDRVSFYALNATQGAVANLYTQSIGNDGFGNTEFMVGVESLGDGTVFIDHFTGDDNANILFAGLNDVVLANGGDDYVYVNSAPGTLDGGAGVDTIGFVGDTNGMLVADTTGDGRAEIVDATWGIYIDLRFGTLEDDGFGNFAFVTGFENVDGSELDDTIIGDDGVNVLSGWGGNDLIWGYGGNDVLDGGEGDDQLRGEGPSSYLGPTGNDTISGGGGNDTMWGGAGVDSFDGGEGTDRVSFYDRTAAQGVVVNLYTQTVSNDGFGNAETLSGVESVGSGTEFADTFIGNDNANFILGGLGDTLQGNGGDDIVWIDGAPASIDGGAGNDTIGFTGDSGSALVADANGDGLADFATATQGAVIDLSVGMIFNDGFGNAVAATGFENVDGSELGDAITGDDGVNVLNGWGGNDVIQGLGGDDIIDGGEGNDQLRGDGGVGYQGPAGNDTLIGGAGVDTMWGGAGVDTYDGGAGNDRISFYDLAATQGASADLNTGIVSNDGFGNAETMINVENLAYGTAYADTFIGNDASNFLAAGFGDTALGGGGDDNIWTAGAPAYVDGGAGMDSIGFIGDNVGALIVDTDGDGLAETIFATNGVYVDLGASYVFDDGFGNEFEIFNFENVDGSELGDTIIGSGTENWLNGWGGDDIIYGFGGDDIVFGGLGDDQIRGDGASAGFTTGNDQLFGEEGDDYLNGGRGVDYYDGGDGLDRVSFYSRTATQAASANLATQTISNDGFGNAETMVNVEGLGDGTQFADTFIGSDDANVMYGGFGDTIIAAGGDDTILVDSAPGVLDGGAGIDTIQFVGDVNGMLTADNDGDGLADIVYATSGVIVSLRSNAIFDDGFGNFATITGIENVDGSQLGDNIQGNDGVNILNGLDGQDVLLGYGGDDILDGGEGTDILRGDGSIGHNGPSGNDVLNGGAGNDILYGGAGVDTFNGGEGRDRVGFFFMAATQGAVANLYTQTISNDGFGNAETMTSIESLGAGTAFADTFIGDDNANFIMGGFGDTLQGNGGDDTIWVDSAPAVVNGGEGTDSIGFIGDINGKLIQDNTGDGLAEWVFATQGVHVDLQTNRIYNDGFGAVGVIGGFENVDGSEFGDNILGDNNVNVLNGWGGDDTIQGRGGNDTLIGGEGFDTLNGGSGNDTASYEFETDDFYVDLSIGFAFRAGMVPPPFEDTLIAIENITGGAGNDTLIGNNSANVLYGLGGSDTIRGNGAADTISGGDGDDTVLYAIGDGADSIDGGADADTLRITDVAAGAAVLNVIYNGVTLTKIENANLINIETITADLGDGVDTLSYGSATTADVTVALSAAFASGFGFVSGIENVTGGAGNDTIGGDTAANVLLGGNGNDALLGGMGNDTLNGQSGIDTVSYVDETSGFAIDLSAGTARRGSPAAAVEDTLVSIENAVGSSLDDVITGNNGANLLSGLGGADTISGGLGIDTISGGAGNDLIIYTIGDGNDVIDGGADFDTLSILGTTANTTLVVAYNGVVITAFGASTVDGVENVTLDLGAGTDTLSYAGATSGVFVDLATTGSGFGYVLGVENVIGGSGGDTLTGATGVNRLEGGSGADTLDGGAGADVLVGGADNDTYYADSTDTISETSTGGVDTVYTSSASFTLSANVETLIYSGAGPFAGTGNGSDNFISGSSAGDTLIGGGGADTLIGGFGNDAMNGGTGNDRFVFTFGGGHDTITAFDANASGGQDLLDISGYGISSANFGSRVSIADLGADMQITIDGTDVITLLGVTGTGANAISQDDFILS